MSSRASARLASTMRRASRNACSTTSSIPRSTTSSSYPGSYLGTKKILAIGGGYDTQNDFRYASADMYLDFPIPLGSFESSIQYQYINGGKTFATLPQQNTFQIEGGVFLKGLEIGADRPVRAEDVHRRQRERVDRAEEREPRGRRPELLSFPEDPARLQHQVLVAARPAQARCCSGPDHVRLRHEPVHDPDAGLLLLISRRRAARFQAPFVRHRRPSSRGADPFWRRAHEVESTGLHSPRPRQRAPGGLSGARPGRHPDRSRPARHGQGIEDRGRLQGRDGVRGQGSQRRRRARRGRQEDEDRPRPTRRHLGRSPQRPARRAAHGAAEGPCGDRRLRLAARPGAERRPRPLRHPVRLGRSGSDEHLRAQQVGLRRPVARREPRDRRRWTSSRTSSRRASSRSR